MADTTILGPLLHRHPVPIHPSCDEGHDKLRTRTATNGMYSTVIESVVIDRVTRRTSTLDGWSARNENATHPHKATITTIHVAATASTVR